MIPAGVRVFVCTEPVDMRRSFDGLAVLARQRLGQEPQSGALFCFVNKRSNRLKVLWWDRNGYCVLSKRLHQAVFVVPGRGGEAVGIQVDGRALATLVAGVSR